MEEELNYPELPEGYVWKKSGVGVEGPPHVWGDVDLKADGASTPSDAIVAWVGSRKWEDDVLFAKNRDTHTGKHGKPTPVSSYQEGINLIHAQLMLGLIGVGKCLEEE